MFYFGTFTIALLLQFTGLQAQNDPDVAALHVGEWGPWFSEESETPDQFHAIIGVACKGRQCDNTALKTIPDVEVNEKDNTWTQSFSDRHSDKTGGRTKGECPQDYIVTRMQCFDSRCATIKLRCTKLKHGQWNPNLQTYRTGYLSEESGKHLGWHHLRNRRYCGQKGDVLVGMVCSKGRYCDTKELLCRGISVNQNLNILAQWQPGSGPGASVNDSYHFTQSSEDAGKKIFTKTSSWATEFSRTVGGTYEGFDFSATMSDKYSLTTQKSVELTWKHHTEEEFSRRCEVNCDKRGMFGFIWSARVTDTTNGDVWVQALPKCIWVCTPGGKPKCPLSFCKASKDKGDCPCCVKEVKQAFPGYDFPVCEDEEDVDNHDSL